MLERAKEIASLVRDLGLIVGVPSVIAVGMNIYDIQNKANEAQVKALEAQNTVLKETQYDRAVSLIESQKKLYELEKSQTARQYELDRNKTAQEIDQLTFELAKNSQKIKEIEAAQADIRACAMKVVAKLAPRILADSPKVSEVDRAKADADRYKLIEDTANRICGLP